jgi:hypothetical protein
VYKVCPWSQYPLRIETFNNGKPPTWEGAYGNYTAIVIISEVTHFLVI